MSSKILDEIPRFPEPSVVVVGGVHGAGKSTLCGYLSERQPFDYLSPQRVEKEFDLQNVPRTTVFKKIQLLVKQHLSDGNSFYFEHVMSGHYVDRLLTKAAQTQIPVYLIYLSLTSERLAMERVDARVAKDGHEVEREKVTQRLNESRSNFWNDYRFRANRWYLLDNSGTDYVKVAEGVGEQDMVISNKRLPEKFLDSLNDERGC